ncbi:uncharacterized protein LOC119066766 [Bradysia coprophila]|uniref:uncharacterized protein LOC119066766 n=1 Tax=Bradysia coprophila TaxID=38358 RepID=UPI00187D7EFF|nr:uncharacterized protein LOC119066766 [Bradysia coprophila]XP_037025301.1 uncharacterized protein LOC119066766 [Bradysia coprophila]
MNPVLPAHLRIGEGQVSVVQPDDPFSYELCVETAVFNKTLNQEIVDFMKNWSTAQIIESYTQTRPHVNQQVLKGLLTENPTFVLYSGVDLIYSKGRNGKKKFLLIETNVYTAGQDAMPPSAQVYETHSNLCVLNDEWKRQPVEAGGLAHMYGRKTRRDYAYPHIMAKLTKESIHVVPMFSKREDGEIETLYRFVDGTMQVKYKDEWQNIRACFCTMSYRTWSFFPVTNNLKTYMCPHPIAGLVGKNKILSEYAYRDFNEKYSKHGIQIRGPKTMVGIAKADIREIVEQNFNGRAVIKTPYDSQGRGVYIIRTDGDLDDFYAKDESDYSLWVVQELIGLEACPNDRYQQIGFHLDGQMYAYSVRIIACNSPSGFKMITICSARAPAPFAKDGETADIAPGLLHKIKTVHEDDVYVTNIASNPDGELRSFYFDDAGVKGMGIGMDDVIDGFMQTVYCTHAIDNMCKKLIMENGELDVQLLRELNPDPQLLAEVVTNWK